MHHTTNNTKSFPAVLTEKKRLYKYLIVQYLLKKMPRSGRILERRTGSLVRRTLKFLCGYFPGGESTAFIQVFMIYVNSKPLSYEVWHYLDDSNTLHYSTRKDHPVVFPSDAVFSSTVLNVDAKEGIFCNYMNSPTRSHSFMLIQCASRQGLPV